MNKAVEIAVSSAAGALTSEFLVDVIKEAKKLYEFDGVFKKLVSTMEEVLPIIREIESLQDKDELKTLKDTIDEADKLVKECSAVDQWTVLLKRPYHSREIDRINGQMLNFCQLQVPLILVRNQIQDRVTLEANQKCIQTIIEMLSVMSVSTVSPSVFRKFCSVPKPRKVPVGLDWPLVRLKKKLLTDSTVDSLLVSAPGGCGKTTLVTHLCHDEEIKGHFKHHIFFIVVSSSPNFKVIVQNLLQHNGYQPLTFENNSQAAAGLTELLEKLIKDGPVLLVLDDVWQGADALLDEFRIKLPGYKILVTSRFELPSFDFTHSLETLKYEDAKSLLIQCALPPHHPSPDDYEGLFQKILGLCNGFPIVIEVLGGSLKKQLSSSWEGQVEIWSEEKTIFSNPDPTVLECLKPSFSALEPNLKECFMDMGSFLEDQKISASVLLDIWVELYGKDNSSCKVYMKYLNDLASRNLLKLITLGGNELEDGFYNELLVTQHDVLRELAIHQSESEAILERKRLNLVIRGDNYPEWEPSINARFLSISTDDLFSSSWVEMDFPNVEALVLNFSSSSYALPSFIATMKKLKVLIIINHGPVSAKLSKLSCLSSLPDLKRIRLEKVSVKLLDILQLQLRSLKKLSLFMCSFGEVFYNVEEIDVSKVLPSLQEIDIAYCYDLDALPYWVCKVASLKTLSITNCNKIYVLPEALGNLSKLEVLRG
ncbi:hypothetical protein Bca52824_020090 [Brassica carinata]|uniref:RPW8 domain-containing protein n=1 Tax=Brassica carinata TaxID=52824 RepID=A0A8X7VS13_BRACI|nr:hypothetical protein Bca52824_020090 [Brassica carinata]